jgi:hypothetical protein
VNISQPFIHRPINFTIAANDQTIPGLRDITLMVSPWASGEVGSLVGRWCLRLPRVLGSPWTV